MPTGASRPFFDLPDAILEKLRERRTQQRARRTLSSRAPGGEYLSTISIVQSLSAETDMAATAQAYVDDMNDLQTQVEQQYDAFLLDPGMGPMTYLATDGRIILDNRTWDGGGIEIETSLDSAISSLVVGAKKTRIPELLGLIPPLVSGTTCPQCEGERWATFHPMMDFKVVCLVCFGRGEVDERLLAQARERGLPNRAAR